MCRFVQVLLTTRNLFQRCLEQSKVAHSSQVNVRSQLKVIGNLVSDYSSILQERQHR